MKYNSKKLAALALTLAMAVSSFGAFGGFDGLSVKAMDPVLVDDGSITICLDAGHGGSDSGALERDSSGKTVSGGLKEKDLNLKIAKYCRDALEKYAKVDVVMTRDTDKTIAALGDRVEIAKKAKATAFVSLHINSASPTAQGAETWYPNSNGSAKIGEAGKGLAQAVQSSLIAAFHSDEDNTNKLYDRGINYKNSQSGSTYSDGKPSDYYGVIRQSKLAGFPGIIVEHGFITNSHDLKTVFASDATLKKLGEADALGIAKYYNLKLRTKSGNRPGYTTLNAATVTGNFNDVDITWQPATEAQEYVIFRKKGKSGTYAELARTKDTHYTDQTPTGGTTYYYTVIANNGAGKAESYDKTGLKVKNTNWGGVVTGAVDGGLMKVTVSWAPVAGADGYRLYRSPAAESSYAKVKDVSASKTSCTDTTVAKGTQYYYTVRPYHLVGTKKVLGTAVKPGVFIETDNDEIVMSAPVLTAEGDVTFSWTSVGDNSSYRIYRKEKGGSYEKLKQQKALTFTDDTAEEGKTYFYRVRAVRQENDKYIYGTYTKGQKIVMPEPEPEETETQEQTEGTDTNTNTTEQTDQSQSTTPAAEETPASNTSVTKADATKTNTTKKVDYAKTTLKVKSLSDAGLRKVKVKWTKISDAEGYKVYRKAAGEDKWTTLTTIKKNSGSYTDATVKKNTTYSYRLRAYKTVNKKKTYTKVDSTGKTIVTDNDSFAITEVSDAKMGSAEITYVGIDDADVTYQIRRRAEDEEEFTLLGTTQLTAFTDETAVLPASKYEYKVRAFRVQDNKNIYSPYTPVVTFTSGDFKTELGSEPVTVGSNKSLITSWKAVDGATGYRLYRKDEDGSWEKIQTLTTNTYSDTGLESVSDYTYRVRAYLTVDGKNYFGSYSDPFTGNTGYTILGESNTTVKQMMAFYTNCGSGRTYPADVFKKYGAPTLQDFCKLVYNISKQNGVRAEVVFAQICKETGFLNTVVNKKTGLVTFGGDVDQDQCNFCGMGTTGGGVKGVDFGDVDWKIKYKDAPKAKSIDYENRTINKNGVSDGLTAQIKHLKLYAVDSMSEVPNDGSDPRYYATIVGKAKYVEWLGIQENPYGTGWAAGANYGYSLLDDYIWRLRAQ